MANVNRPSGASPIRSVSSPWNGQANLYYIPSTDNDAWYIGDFCITEDGADANGVGQIKKAAATDTPLRGVVVGFVADPTNLNQISVPASKTRAYYAWVVDDPNAEFDIQADAAGAANLVAAMVGDNAKFIVTAPTPSTGPISATTLDSSNIADTNTFPLKILGLRQLPNNAFGAYCRVRVKINAHELQSVGTSGV